MGRCHLLLLISISLSMAEHAIAGAKCRPEDQFALLAFRKTFVIDPTAPDECNSYNYNESVDCCKWQGIRCDSSTGHVIRVSVGLSCYQGTRSTFSSTSPLFQLSSLKILRFWFRFNLQQVTIPNEIAKLSQLRTLIINQGNLSGTIPEAIGKLTKLRELDLSFNGFSGGIPLSLANLTNLKTLSLPSCGLTGTIPNALVKSPQLQRVLLTNNSLSGTIPVDFFNHRHLWELDVSSNQLVGSLPSTDPGPSNLSQLVLANNRLHGTIPSWLFSIPSLRTLDLSRNSLDRIQPFPQPAVTSLDSVDLGFNMIRGQLPSSLLQLVNVSSLSLEANQLTGDVEWNSFKNMASLASLFLSLNRGLNLKNTESPPINLPSFGLLDIKSCSQREFPSFLGGIVWSLDVSENEISGSAFKEGGWTNLYFFNGSHNNFTGFEFPNGRLNMFDMSYNALEGPLPEAPSSLSVISLANNQLSGGIPTHYCNLTSLEVLDLGHNNLNGLLPPCLMNISQNMGELNLQNNHFRGAIPDSIRLAYDSDGFSNNQLTLLMFSNNNFEGPLPKSLANCIDLRVLDVGNNQITDTFPLYLGQLQSLQILILSSNRFTGTIGAPATEDQFSNLQILDVSSNNFSGLLPAEMIQNSNYMQNAEYQKTLPLAYMDYVGGRWYILGNKANQYDIYRLLISVDLTVKGVKLRNYNVLYNLTVLDFSNNQFSGKIPTIIGDLKALKILNMSQNKLTGEIPSETGNMTAIESLDLSRNALGGEIPASLMNLEHLEDLNLSYNNLEGPIPMGKFSSASYVGNPGLCGPPLFKSC